MTFHRCLIVSLTLLGLLPGCLGEKVPRPAAVEGNVTWEDQPVENGTIVFTPIKGTPGRPASATITDGLYFLEREAGPSVGPNKVEFYIHRKTGKTIKSPLPGQDDIEVTEQILAAKFNTESEFETQITSGSNVLNFDLVP